MTGIGSPKGTHGLTTNEEAHEGTGRICLFYEASAAIDQYDVVITDGQTTDDKMTVDVGASADDNNLVIGVAQNAAAAGDIVKVCVLGPTLVNIGSNTVAKSELAILDDAGNATGVAADAADVAGDQFGVYLGAEVDSTNQAVVFVKLGI